MANFSINGTSYQSRLMDGETQTLVLKRLLPAFTALVGIAPDLGEAASATSAAEPSDATESASKRISGVLMPVIRELADLDGADVQFIMNACLDITKRQASGGGVGWVDVRQRGLVQDRNDDSFKTRLTIVWHVLGENFGEMLASFGLDISALTKVGPQA